MEYHKNFDYVADDTWDNKEGSDLQFRFGHKNIMVSRLEIVCVDRG